MKRALAAVGLVVAVAGGGLAYHHHHASVPTFTRDVAPIVYARCVSCHAPGRVGPFSLRTYAEVVDHADDLVAVTADRTMPPWLPAPGYQHYLGDRSLTDEQIATLARWRATRLREGDPRDLPPLPDLSTGWVEGEPDLVLELPQEYTIPAAGPDIYRHFVLPSPVAETRWIRAVEIIPGNARIVHHAVITLDHTGASRYHDSLDPEPGFDGLMSTGDPPEGQWLAWVPGKRKLGVDRYPWRLEPGVDLLLQLHLQTTGKVESTGARLGLYFADGPPAHTPVLLPMASRRIDIPAGARHYPVTRAWTLPADVSILGFWPHAHYLATTMSVYATLPGGERVWLLHIPRWNFAWQDEFHFAEPVVLPRGSVLTFDYRYDNSAANDLNPNHPPQPVRYGVDSKDEMAILEVCALPARDEDRRPLQQWAERQRTADAIADYEAVLVGPGMARVDRVELGDFYRRAGRLDDAEAAYRASLDGDPGFAQGHAKLGVLLRERGRLDDAIAEFEAALSAGDVAAEMHSNIGAALAAKGQLDRAIEHLEKAISLWPSYPEAHYNLGNALAAAGRTDEAIAELRLAARERPFAEAVNNLGIALASRGDHDGARDEFRAALRIDPHLAGARDNLLRALGPRARLGIGIGPAVGGLPITSVAEGSLAQSSGLLTGDLLTMVGGRSATPRLLEQAIDDARINGDPLVLTVDRDHRSREIAIVF